MKNGGRLILNINDVNDHIKKEYYVICKPMIDYMLSNFEDCTYEGIIGYPLAKAKHQADSGRGDLKGVIAEPMFVFAKGNATPPPFVEDKGSIFF